MNYTQKQIEDLKSFAEKLVNEINENLNDNLDYVYRTLSREDYNEYADEVKEFISEYTVDSMLEYIVDWGQTNEIPFEELEDEFEIDDDCFGIPRLPC